MTLGERVKSLREREGMNQKELADASTISQATISRIESGQIEELKSDALIKLAEVLKVTVDYLIGKTNKMNPEELVTVDSDANYIFRGYEKLSNTGKKQFKEFLRFLELQEKGKGKRRK